MSKDANCIFCKIIDKQIPAKTVAENNDYIAIRDINPQAPTHVLIISKEHYPNLGKFENPELLGRLFKASTDIADQEKLTNGYRVVVNTGEDAGQTVDHLHIHVLGGRPLGWPPG